LDVDENQLLKWGKPFSADPAQTFPGHGQMKPEQLEIEKLRRERNIVKRGRSLLREGRNMRFTFIAKHRGVWPVARLCEALDVSRSGFHAWLNRSPSRRARDDEEIGASVRASFLGSDRTPGARRVWRDVLAECIDCGLHRIERLIRKADGLRSAIAPNTLRAACLIQRWIAYFTYIWTTDGWRYVAAFIDRFSRRLVGCSMKAEMIARLVRCADDGDLAPGKAGCPAAQRTRAASMPSSRSRSS
jgi:putative transposase